ncbi:Hypothetical_protein [Hexamita inflata]|uniref:Hypothetical_protein n=1 Tax=Hexamita inflata TaxID=28002 RepID=A0AA86U6H9_9EUKA|nr:Hypothetical protein HINF_LOCUS27317 [Hexamita inflata]
MCSLNSYHDFDRYACSDYCKEICKDDFNTKLSRTIYCCTNTASFYNSWWISFIFIALIFVGIILWVVRCSKIVQRQNAMEQRAKEQNIVLVSNVIEPVKTVQPQVTMEQMYKPISVENKQIEPAEEVVQMPNSTFICVPPVM